MAAKPLLGPCDSYQLEPFAYEWAWTMARAQENNNWAPEEIAVAGDVADWKSPDTDPKHRHLFQAVMAQLTTFDIERGDDAAAMDNPVAPAAAGPVAPAAPAPADIPEDDAARTRQAREDHALEDQALEEMTRLLQARAADPGPDITLPVIPDRWMPEIRVKLLAMEGPDTEITLRVMTEGIGSYWSMKTSHRTPMDPEEADFLPLLGRGLCAVMDTIFPPEQRLAVAARETAKATRPDPAGARISRPAGWEQANRIARQPSRKQRMDALYAGVMRRITDLVEGSKQ